MIVCLRLDPNQTRAWHRSLRERLAARDDTHVVCAFATGRPISSCATTLLRLESRLRGRPGGRLAARVPPEAFGAPAGEPPEGALTIDLTGLPSRHDRVWTLAVDGRPGEDTLWDAVLMGRSPVVEVREGSRVIAAGRVGTEARGQLIDSLEDALARTITLIDAALSGSARSTPVPAVSNGMPQLNLGRAAKVAAAVVSRRLARRVYRLAFRTPHWRVGWRKLAGPDLIDLRRHPEGGWREIPDDSLRFYADPFPILRQGQVTLFVEDFPHETGRGIISAVPFGSDGPIGRPEPVLERPYHLSYPFVFERDGETWMIPESAEAGTIDLYRATRFPGGWVHETTLVSGVEAGDATLHEADGRWWMFATVKDGGATSDALHLWSAPDFRGPWRPHPRNPVLIDIASARPAGRMTVRDGALVRPVQDCRGGYGAALGLATVTRLDDDGFAQHVETVLRPGPRWPGHALHTVNQAGGFEFIDGSGRASRLKRARPAVRALHAADGVA